MLKCTRGGRRSCIFKRGKSWHLLQHDKLAWSDNVGRDRVKARFGISSWISRVKRDLPPLVLRAPALPVEVLEWWRSRRFFTPKIVSVQDRWTETDEKSIFSYFVCFVVVNILPGFVTGRSGGVWTWVVSLGFVSARSCAKFSRVPL